MSETKVSTEPTAEGNECVRINNSVIFFIGHESKQLLTQPWTVSISRDNMRTILPYLQGYAETGKLQPLVINDDYVAWCRYTDKTIVTCDSDAEGAFRVYRSGDKATMRKFNQMADCLDDIRKLLEDKNYYSRISRLQAISDLINFDIPDTPRDIEGKAQAAIYSRPDCPFNYCDQAPPHTACQVTCRHDPK